MTNDATGNPMKEVTSFQQNARSWPGSDLLRWILRGGEKFFLIHLHAPDSAPDFCRLGTIIQKTRALIIEC